MSSNISSDSHMHADSDPEWEAGSSYAPGTGGAEQADDLPAVKQDLGFIGHLFSETKFDAEEIEKLVADARAWEDMRRAASAMEPTSAAAASASSQAGSAASLPSPAFTPEWALPARGGGTDSPAGGKAS